MNNLVHLRNAPQKKLFALLFEVFESKISADQASGKDLFDGEMIYGMKPQGGDAQFLRELLQHQRFGFPVVTEYRRLSDIDRTATMFSGPFYTSDEFPWPDQSDGHIEPLFQVDLDFASKVAGFDIGSGLVQLWMDDRNSIIRHMPREAISRNKLTEVPLDLALSNLADDPNIYSRAAAESRTANWTLGGHQMLSVGGSEFRLHPLINQFLEGSLIDRGDEYENGLVEKAERCLQMIKRLELSGQTNLVSSTNATFFGNYNPSNSDAGLETVLINYQPDEVLQFGRDNGAILFYSADSQDGNCWFDLEF